MKNFTIERRNIAILEGVYVIARNATIRETAVFFNRAKSTVHDDLSQVLPETDYRLYSLVLDVFDEHLDNRARNGALAKIKKREYGNK